MNTAQNGPDVRIGVIQSIESVEIQVNVGARLMSANNELLQTIPSQSKLRFTKKDAQPAKMQHALRLAKCSSEKFAQELIKKLAVQNITASSLQVGTELEFADRSVDNYEYWVITGSYASQQAAQQAASRPQLLKMEDNTPLAIPLIPPGGKILLAETVLGDVVRIVPEDTPEARITVSNVRVGIEFHWDHIETQDYRGIIEIRFNNDGKLQVINELPVEDYLFSVNSSEMTPDCPLDLLKAQTVAARSTIFATMGKHHFGQAFHLCADDHCQCYRGTRYEQDASWQAVKACQGETLFYKDQVCDARYAKICGGVMESYENVWENKKIDYLVSGIDGEIDIDYPLDTEEKAEAYIDSSPDVYCNTDRYELPRMLEYSNHLFRWKVTYSRSDLEALITKKTGEDIGELLDLRPLQRGESGRLVYIEIVGTKKSLRIGKELAIRRVLSESHLYSSCFYVEKEIRDGKATTFTLVGAGWGHGVGLCQVGATIMAQKGFSYQAILSHYFKNSELIKLY